MPKAARSPLVLIIRDGWGENPNPAHAPFNAIKLARTPVDDSLRGSWPQTLIHTSGEDVGLPEGTMGNSEVGHQNIGAGRIVDQESVAITKACRAGLAENEVIAGAIGRSKQLGSAVHLMGICSTAGVHGLLSHLYACLEAAKKIGHTRVFIHAFMDGRDTGPFTGKAFIKDVETTSRTIGVGQIASVIGRYWAMDRDYRWERVERAYACLTGHNAGALEVASAVSPTDAIQQYYDRPMSPTQKGDEFVPPTMIGRDHAEALSRRITDNDCVIFYNYRGDRPRELVRAFVLPEFDGHVPPSPDTQRRGFDRGRRLSLEFVTMAAYEEALGPFVRVAFPKPPKFVNIGGEYVSRLGLTQFRCAETEKYPHVTFFFNDYREEPFPGERRCIIQSPKVATYDLQPEMSANGVCEATIGRLNAPDCEDFIVVNFANADMVGHTGSLQAAVLACETVDACVGRLIEATQRRGGSLIITADHGNAEQMWDPTTNSPHTAHTVYDVPLFVVGPGLEGRRLRKGGRLADVLPTALAMMGVAKPPEMTGVSLLEA